MKEHKINKNNNFINGWYIDSLVCDDLIDYFEKSDRKEFGRIGAGEVNKEKKKFY